MPTGTPEESRYRVPEKQRHPFAWKIRQLCLMLAAKSENSLVHPAIMAGPSIAGKQHEDSHALAEPKKRKQISHACIPCSKSKNRCDDERPCGRCMRTGIQVHQVDQTFTFTSIEQF